MVVGWMVDFFVIPFGGRKSTLLISEKDAKGEILFRLLPLSLSRFIVVGM